MQRVVRDSSRLLGDGDAVDPLNRATLITAFSKNLKTLGCEAECLEHSPLDACYPTRIGQNWAVLAAQ